jgi:ribosomal protein S18 acetylase RimI-like enzyme
MDAAFRPAEPRDADAVISLFRQAIAHMRQNGIDQWDELYPTEAILCDDIANGEMFVLAHGEDILSAVVINAHQDDEYAAGDWRCGEHAAVIHRLCVHPKHQHQGVAKETMRHAEQLIAQQGYGCIRFDAFTQNPYALRLYEGLGYSKAGEITFRKGRFALFEKALP